MKALLLAASLALPATAIARPLVLFHELAVSPRGDRIASVETLDVPVDGRPPARLLIRDLAGQAVTVVPECAGAARCQPGSPSWNAAGDTLAFLVDEGGRTAIETVAAGGGAARTLLVFPGPLDTLRFGRGDRLTVLATADATKEVGRAEAGAPVEGEVQTHFDEQRIAVVDADRLRFVSPPDLYVYEYAERPDGSFVGTAAHGDGDANWWVAGLYGFGTDGSAQVLFQPGPREQLASPVVSPDGRQVAFVGGWMSDFGSTGGDAYRLDLAAGAKPVDLTPGLPATVTGLDWGCGDALVASELAGAKSVLTTLDAAPRVLRRDPMVLTALSCAAGHAAVIAQDFTHAPEVLAGPVNGLRAVTRVNEDAIAAPGQARSLTWQVDGRQVQGWLFTPPGAERAARPLIVDVHGGPEAAARPRFATRGSEIRAFLDQGWDVIEPNYRGSFGAGEAFASASIGDLGGGDWRDTLASIDAAKAATAIDETRLAITGGSYGGYMAMWAVTQTHRFRAAMADAGVSGWLSIEGEAPQAGSDQVNFGGSVYDNAAPYLRASPVMHVKGATTPTLIIVGDRDLECPMPQSLEFHTALAAQGVPDSFVVYRNEGHAFSRETDRRDRQSRTIVWFSKWFATVDRRGGKD